MIVISATKLEDVTVQEMPAAVLRSAITDVPTVMRLAESRYARRLVVGKTLGEADGESAGVVTHRVGRHNVTIGHMMSYIATGRLLIKR